MLSFQHFKECTNAGSVCYNEKFDLLIVSMCKAISKGDDTPNEIWIYDKDFNLTDKILVPVEPKISIDYVRWVTADLSSDDIWLSTGDNKCAVLWRYVKSNKTWKLITEQIGDLDHPCFINEQQLAIISWTEDEQWKIKVFDFNSEKDKIVATKIVNVTADTNEITEPWSLTVADNGTIYAYDYQSGCIIPFRGPNYKKAGDFVASVKAGQFVAIQMEETNIYVSCSDERCVHVFRRKNFKSM